MLAGGGLTLSSPWVESVAGEDYAALRFALGADGSVSVVGPEGVPISAARNGPVSIFLTAGTKIDTVSRRLGVSLARLAELNPDFEAETPAGAMRSVRIQ